jgi:hypothetical protein
MRLCQSIWRFWRGDGGQAELQFDRGLYVRLGLGPCCEAKTFPSSTRSPSWGGVLARVGQRAN